MGNGWKKIDDAKEGGGFFIKLKNGESIEGLFRGEPYCFYQIFEDKKEYSERVEGSSFKFKINFIIKEKGAYVPKILQQGVTLAKLVRKYTNECGMDTLFKIEREGSGKDDTTYYLIPKGPVLPESLKQINAVKLLPLQKSEDDTSFNPEEYEKENPSQDY